MRKEKVEENLTVEDSWRVFRIMAEFVIENFHRGS